jgi:hypothetical protein
MMNACLPPPRAARRDRPARARAMLRRHPEIKNSSISKLDFASLKKTIEFYRRMWEFNAQTARMGG